MTNSDSETVRRTAVVAFHEPIPGGATLSVLRLRPILVRQGWRLVFWAPRPSGLYDLLEAEAGVEIHGAERHMSYSLRALRLPPGPRRRITSLPGYLGAFARMLREVDPDVVHLNSLTTLAEVVVARRLGLPTVQHIHEMIKPTRKGDLTRAALRRLPDEVIGVSAACTEGIASTGWRPRTVHEATDPGPDPVRLTEHRVASSGDPLHVVSVGVISRRKGSDVFVEAAERVRRADPSIRFTLVGSATDPLDADFAAGVLERASAAGVEHRPRADVPELLTGTDLFVLPSRRDPFPISVLEAMAAGLPVIGSDADGIPEQLDGGGCGVVVPSEDPVALAAAILELAADPDRRLRLGAAARERVSSRFTLERQAAGLEAAWLAAIRSGGTRG